MTPDIYIDKLLQKYKQAPSFPFDDWVENPVSFYALINFWDEMFKTASGQQVSQYKSVGEVKQDPDSRIYMVIDEERNKKFYVMPDRNGGIFYLITNYYEEPYLPPEEYCLGVVADLDRTRLICIYNMIRHYVSNPISTDNDRKKMDSAFIESYGKYFGFPDYNPFNSPLFPTEEPDHDDD